MTVKPIGSDFFFFFVDQISSFSNNRMCIFSHSECQLCIERGESLYSAHPDRDGTVRSMMMMMDVRECESKNEMFITLVAVSLAVVVVVVVDVSKERWEEKRANDRRVLVYITGHKYQEQLQSQ